MKTVLIISYSTLDRDPRILRQVEALKDRYKIITIGTSKINDPNILFYDVINYKYEHKIFKRTFFQKVIRRLGLYFNLIKNLINYNTYTLERKLNLHYIIANNIETPDIIIANDWNGLYLASQLKKKKYWQSKVYFDAHEYAPKEMDHSIRWRLTMKNLVIWALRKCKIDICSMSTVCEGIAREYERFFKFPKYFVKVVTNASDHNKYLKPNVIGNKIKLIHHGGAMKSRKLESLIHMMKYLCSDKYELTFMMVKSDLNYYNYLINLSKKHKNIIFIEPVAFSEIVNTLNNYDIGVYILKPINYNDKHALPNKLFEFIQARLAIAIGPSVEMVKIIKQYDLGVYSNYFTPRALADTITRLTPEKIMEFKQNSDKHAIELSAEDNINKIRDIIFELES